MWSKIKRSACVGVALTLASLLLVPESAGGVRRVGTRTVSLAQAGAKLAGALGDEAGFRVQAAGDLDGDGSEDLVVGAWSYDRPADEGAGNEIERDAGAAYVVYGPVSSDMDLAGLADEPDAKVAKLVGEAAGAYAGEALAGGIDVNGDGLHDLLIGAPGPIVGQPGDLRPGRTYLIYGSRQRLRGTRWLPDVADATFLGEVPMDGAGLGLDAGYIDDDRFADVVIAGPGWNGLTGKVWVVYGQEARFTGLLPLSQNAAAQFVGEHPDSITGFSVAGGDDLDGDGFSDLVIGAQGFGALNGAAYVVYGDPSRFSGTRSVASAGVRLIGEAPGDIVGTSVTTGELDGDGLADLVVGAPGVPPTTAGSTYVFYGGPRLGPEANIGTADVILTGESGGDKAGYVAVVPDLASGGPGTLAVGAIGQDGGGIDAGAVYLMTLTSKGRRLTGRVSLATASKKFVGERSGDEAGRSPVGALDANGDGFSDLLIGARRADKEQNDNTLPGPPPPAKGAAYLVFGEPD